MEIAEYARRRYTTKVFDPNKRIEPALIDELLTLLRYTPSSTNSQPWHFLLAESEEARARVATSTSGPYAFNTDRVLNASHVLVLCSRVAMDDDHLQDVLEQEERDGRYANAEARAGSDRGRRYFVDLHRYAQKDLQGWMEKQVYIALGFLLLGAATLGIDACPIEGFDPRLLDEAFDLHSRGLTSIVMVSLGYRGEGDYNAGLPKSRLDEEVVITRA